jgi:hypothetical protein
VVFDLENLGLPYFPVTHGSAGKNLFLGGKHEF